MESVAKVNDRISPLWKQATIVTIVIGLAILIWVSVRSYENAPPIPEKAISTEGKLIWTGDDVTAGQSVFLKYGLMENGTIWGHGAYLGPDFSAQYLHALTIRMLSDVALTRYNKSPSELIDEELSSAQGETERLLKQNRYDPAGRILVLTPSEVAAFSEQVGYWAGYFSTPQNNRGLTTKTIRDSVDLKQLTAFFAWAAWASVADRPGFNSSYTNNFPYAPESGNRPTTGSYLWSTLSLITLLGATGLVLFIVGKFDYLGWKGHNTHVHPQMVPLVTTASQRATIKYFLIAAVLFLAQAVVGGATAHYRADPGSFYGIDISSLFPSNILRTWHLQLAIFWIATAYVGGGLLLAPAVGGTEPRGQSRGVHLLFGALVIVVAGSLLGEILGINQLLGNVWFWFGHQGWEYLDLGRAWQILLAAGLVLWLILLFRALKPARSAIETSEISSLFLYSAIAIPIFYLPAMFFSSTTNFTVVDTWRFWIIHLWVEGFFELFVTAMVAVIFFKLGLVTHTTATRVVYLDAILYLGSGIVGTGHHWYWTGQSEVTLALAAMFSAMETVPLTLLTLDAWDFIKLTRGRCDICNQVISVPHKWTFYFLMAVGFWNFVGAGIFGFLINLPIVSYFEVGTMLTPNHGHAAMMGVFGMLAVALMVFSFRQVVTDAQWATIQKYVRLSFWGLNAGLALMVITNLFPGGVVQLLDVLKNGYWHARSPEFLDQEFVKTIEWLRLPGDVVFITIGILPLVYAGLKSYLYSRENARGGIRVN